MSDTPDALHRAKQAAGGVNNLARQIGITSQAISQWDRVPAERVLAVETATGVSRHDLRPDIYGPAPPPAPPATDQPGV